MTIEPAPARTGYRPELDGLRAVAIALVVAFHLRPTTVPGGFIGVDIFFVISGYLIGGQVLNAVAEDRFSFTRFFASRARRLLPALIVVLALTTTAAIWVFYPSQLQHFGSHLVFAVSGLSNFKSATEGAYFAPSDNVLSHLWTLSIETQFYILLPLLVIGLQRNGLLGKVGIVIAIVTAFSFIAACVAVRTNIVFAFFSTTTRAWEFLLGTVALRKPPPFLNRLFARNILAIAALAAILTSTFLLDSSSPFPGAAALPACLGALAIIMFACPERTIVGWMLASPPFVFIGLISYSLYLVHLPLIRLTTLLVGSEVHHRGWQMGMLAACIGLAILQWRFVELPFRRVPWSGKASALIFGGPLAILGGLGIALALSGGLPNRFPVEASRLAAYENYDFDPIFRTGRCMIATDPNSRFDDAFCATPDPREKNWLLIGDSHAADLWRGLQSALPNVRVMQATAAACRMSVTPLPTMRRACTELMHHIFFDLVVKDRPDRIILSARWHSDDYAPLTAILDYLHKLGIPVLVLGPSPEYIRDLPLVLADSIARGNPALAQQSLVRHLPGLDAALRKLAVSHGARYSSVIQALCISGRCTTLVNGVPVLFDTHHFTLAGASLLAGRLRAEGYLAGTH